MTKFRIISGIVTAGLILLYFPTPAGAGPIFSNLNTIHSTAYNITGPDAGNGSATLAQGTFFIPTHTAAVSGIRLIADYISGQNLLIVKLQEDQGGNPGNILETFIIADQLGTFGSLVSADSVLNPVIQAGAPYWFVLYPGELDTRISWHGSNSDYGPTNISIDNGVTWQGSHFPAGTPIYEVDGTSGSVVSEPASMTLTLYLVGGLLAFRWRGGSGVEEKVGSLFEVDRPNQEIGDGCDKGKRNGKVQSAICCCKGNAVLPHVRAVAVNGLTYLGHILASDGHFQKYLLSKLILQSCDNFAIAPKYYDTLSPDRKAALCQFFVDTILENDKDNEDERLYLF